MDEKFQECSKRDGVGLAYSVETKGLDLRTRKKKLEVKDKARMRNCDVRFFIATKNRFFSRAYEG